MLNLTCFVDYCHDKKKKMSVRLQGGMEGGGAFDIRGGGEERGAGGVVNDRESRDFISPEVNIPATFTASRNYPVSEDRYKYVG